MRRVRDASIFDQLLGRLIDHQVMYVTEVPNRGAKPTILLRESFREDGKTKNRTLANLTHLPPHLIEAVRRAARNETLVNAADTFEVVRSFHHGHVDAVLAAMRRLRFDKLIASEHSRERDLVLGMVAARIIDPRSKLDTTRSWKTTTLPAELGITDADEQELYGAMDWLLARQERIEAKLARRHLDAEAFVLYDLSSTYMEGTTCPLAKLGYNRDGKPHKLQVNFGLLTDFDGRPVAVRVFEGNVSDPKTVAAQVETVRERFGVELVVLVGDRGMITEAHIDSFNASVNDDGSGVAWVTALKTGAIRKLRAEGSLQLGLFDEKNLFSITSPDHPGERLVACRNLELKKRREKKRQDLLEATRRELERVRRMVKNGRLVGKAQIGMRVGRVINKYKVAKHFAVKIEDRAVHYRVRQDRVAEEAALDGIYVVRTSVPAEAIPDADVVRCYKRLARVERAFRSMKTVDLKVRPVFHRLSDRVRAHIFLCMLAYYVEWHMRQAWAPLLFAEEEDLSWTRDPVAKAEPSPQAKRKASLRVTEDNLEVQSFHSLVGSLASIVRNECCRVGAVAGEPNFIMTTRPTPLQARARALLETIPAA